MNTDIYLSCVELRSGGNHWERRSGGNHWKTMVDIGFHLVLPVSPRVTL